MSDLVVSTLPQSAGEAQQYDFDFAPLVPAGLSIASAVATHLPPNGSAGSITIGAADGLIVPVRLALSGNATLGYHRLDVQATTNNNLTPVIHLSIPVKARYGALE